MRKVWCFRKDTPQALLDKVYFRIGLIDTDMATIFKDTRSCLCYKDLYDMDADAEMYLEESYYKDFNAEGNCSADYVYMLLIYYGITKLDERLIKSGKATFTDIKEITPTLH